MAKRRRLTPATVTEAGAMTQYPYGVVPKFPALPPVAQVASDVAARAALDDLAAEVTAARTGGRMVLDLPLEAVDAGHLLRDRLGHDPDRMAELEASLAARGQQMPVEVVDLGDGRYGLISGARRLAALTALRDRTGDPDYSRIKALVRPVETAAEAYVAMVEENEIRADLSFYERGRLVAEAARMGLYDSSAEAAKGLFGHTLPAKRSKILAFVTLHQGLGEVLRFPTAIPEKLGLALVAAFAADRTLRGRLANLLRRTPAEDAASERLMLEQALKKDTDRVPVPDVVPGVALEARKGRVVLSGTGVDAALAEALAAWLRAR